MTNIAQIGHVMMKDIREFRWLLAAYLCVVALATGHALRLSGLDGELAGYLMILVVVTGMLVAASLVQGDSPVRVDAFWATHPLNSGAVLLAKVALIAIVVIGVPAIGELAGLITYRIPARDLPATLGASMWEYGRWLLIAMTIGALARDLRTVVIALICIPVYFIALLIWASIRTPSMVHPAPSAGFTMPVPVWVVTFIAGGAGLLWYEYRSRDSRPRTWIAGIAIFLTGIASVGAGVARAASKEVAENVPRTTVSVSLAPYRAANRESVPELAMRLDADSIPRSQKLAVIGGVAIVTLRDGTVFRERIERQAFPGFTLTSAAPGIRWLGERDATRTSVTFSVFLSDSTKKALEGELKGISIEARLAVSVPDYADTLPLQIGATAAHNGSRMTITKLSAGGSAATVTLGLSEVLANIEAAGAGPFNAAESTVSLVNDVRHEAIAMETQGAGYQTGWLVLPGNPTRTGHGTWAPPRRFQLSLEPGEALVNDAWLRDARLVVMHWKQVGSYPVRAELAVP